MKTNSLLMGMACLLGVVSQAQAINFLDDMIYSVKCAGATDTEACKAQAQKDFEDYSRQKQSGTLGSTSTESSNTSSFVKQPEQCYNISASGPANIDMAYAMLVDRFGFMTMEEKAAWIKQRRGRAKDDGFKHRAIPGYLYDMRDTVFDYKAPDGTAIVMFAGAKLTKTKTGSTNIEADYCLIGEEINYSAVVSDAFKRVVR